MVEILVVLQTLLLQKIRIMRQIIPCQSLLENIMQFRKYTRMPLDTYFLQSLTSLMLPLLTEQETLEKVFWNSAQANEDRVQETTVPCIPHFVSAPDKG